MPDMKSSVLQDIVWNDLLWSDPQEEKGSSKSKRGVGVHWGPDITDQFMEDNPGISCIVRSHDLIKKKGHHTMHNEIVITVFSASNYCGSGNKGALIRFTSKNWPMPIPIEYVSLELAKIAEFAGKGKESWAKEGELLRKEDAKLFEDKWWAQELSKLMVAVVESKPAIRTSYLHLTGGEPLVAQNEWEDILAGVLGEDWHLQKAWDSWRFVLHGDSQLLSFPDFLRRFTVVIKNEEYMSFKFNAIARVFDAVLHEHASLSDTLKRFDKDGNGKVDMKSFREALKTFDLGLSSAQMDSLLHIFFEKAEKDSEGVLMLPVDAFLERFAIVYRQAEDAMGKGEQSEEERVEHEAMGKIGHLIATTPLEELEAAIMAPDPVEEEYVARGPVYGIEEEEKALEPEAKEAKETKEEEEPKDAKEKHKKDKDEHHHHKDHKDKKDKDKKDEDKENKGDEQDKHHHHKDHKDKKDKDKKDESKSDKGKKDKSKVKHNVGAKMRIRVERVFQLLDGDTDGFIETKEFVKGISKIPGVQNIELSDGTRESAKHLFKLAGMLDKGGKINIMEFLGAFCMEDNDGITDALAEHMIAILFRFRHILRAGARYFDEHDEGTVHKEEFLLVLQALNAEIEEGGLHFSEAQIDDLCEGVSYEDKDKVFLFPYEEFFNAFEVIDQQNIARAVQLQDEVPEDENQQDK